jgi:hypothetical protein
MVTMVYYGQQTSTLFGWLVADGWCWFVLIEEYCWLVAGGWFVVREKYCWLVADKPTEQGACPSPRRRPKKSPKNHLLQPQAMPSQANKRR